MRFALGHDGPPQGLWRENLITGKPLAECPLMTLRKANQETVVEIVRHENEYHPLFKRGFLLVRGGIAEQPNRWLEFMRELDEVETAMKNKLQEIAEEERANKH